MAKGTEDWVRETTTDITAQTIGNIAVDIAAQALATLAVDIKAQTLSQLDVDIVAQSLSALGINITAQDLAELVIKIAAQTVGVYVERDWASTQDEDKSLTGIITVASGHTETVVTYTVPTGKVLYIDDIVVATDEYIATFYLKLNTTTIWQVFCPPANALQHTFTTPRKFTAGEVVKVDCYAAVGATNGFIANLSGREYSV